MSNERRCQVCNEIVAPHWTSDRQQEDGWYMNNVAPAAASGGTMRPVHYRCRPLPVLVTKAELDAARAEIARLTEQRDRAMAVVAAARVVQTLRYTESDTFDQFAALDALDVALAALNPEAAAEPEGT